SVTGTGCNTPGKRRTVGGRHFAGHVHEPEYLPRPEAARRFRTTWHLRGEGRSPRAAAPTARAGFACPRRRFARGGEGQRLGRLRPTTLRSSLPYMQEESSMSLVTHLGFPRIGLKRELKRALEAHWRGEAPAGALRDAARALRARHWQLARDAARGRRRAGLRRALRRA